MKRNENAKWLGLVWVLVLLCCVVLGLGLMCCQETSAEEPAAGKTPAVDSKASVEVDGKTPTTAEEFFQLGQKYQAEAGYFEDEEANKIAEENWRKSVECLRRAADMGYAPAMCALGRCYDEGDGVDMDEAQALKWYRKAAELGHLDAMVALGDCYYDGEGVKEDLAETAKWWHKAAEKQGKHLPVAYAYLRTFDEKDKDDGGEEDLPETVKKLLQAARQGDADAQAALGEYYEMGDGGETKQDLSEKWFQRGAPSNDGNDEITQDLTKAVLWYRKAAKQGSAKAQYCLGRYLERQYDPVFKDYPIFKTHRWYQKAIAQGYTPAMVAFADLCIDDGQKTEAVQWYRKAAELGDSNAQAALGQCYEGGEGVEKNLTEAVKWYRKAAEAGNWKGQIALGECYCDGDGVEVNRAEALKWWRKAIKQNDDVPMFYLAECGVYDDDESEDELSETMQKHLQAAKKGDVEAMVALGECYEDEEGDRVQALQWYRKAANQGNAKAQLKTGWFYNPYTGVSREVMLNRFKALKWWFKAADQGYAPAMVALADYYSACEEPRKAFEWCRKAAELGDAEAQYGLGGYYQLGAGVKENHEEAVKWFQKAAEQGNRQALFDLALCYQDGDVEQDLTKAFAYYQKIVDCGKDDFSDDWRDAAYHLARYYENGMGVEKDLAKALEWYRKAAEDGQEEAEKALKRLEGGDDQW